MSENGASFADLLEESLTDSKQLEPGQKIQTEIVRISGSWIFIDLGGKSEGSLSAEELRDKEGNLSVKEGDSIEVYFLGVERNEKIFTTKIGGAASKAHLEEAYRSGVPVEGTIKKEVKGGYEVNIAGNVRAFCPYSQLDIKRAEEPEQYLDQSFSFQIIEYKENGRNIIVSRRAILEEERQELKEKMRETLEVGQVVKGTITSLRDFGAFVDIGGLEGLIPISEISYGRISDIHSALEEGQQVEVSIMKLDWDNDRFSFSLKETLPDPWDTSELKEGTVLTGTVARLMNFGAFVTLSPGIDGLVHISNLGAGRRINHPREVVKEGDILEVRITSIDLDNKRISLSLPEQETEDDPAEKRKSTKKGKYPQDDNRNEFKKFQKQEAGKEGSSMGTLGDLLKAKMSKK
ncbi:MAG: 30S ribosomal protein S1 [Desulfobulbaceae bacterium]|uniref:30S ribosomal protein S1 n=1 Tax=Candidatus Desulfobia pelagia TaxID=2841692 RepID=A0A8J6TF77_9BACT|nr:30S ribosomal protein S1 [Candidatus Desulfobia pelagia]